jgi:hypothetical protein
MAISKKDIREAGDPIENEKQYWMLEREHGDLPPWITEKINRGKPIRDCYTLSDGVILHAYYLRSDELLPRSVIDKATQSVELLERFRSAYQAAAELPKGAPKYREQTRALFVSGYGLYQEAWNEAQEIYAQQDR